MNKSKSIQRQITRKRSAAPVRPDNDSHVEDTLHHEDCLNNEDPYALEAGVILQKGGPLARYRAASPLVCHVAKVSGWIAVLVGAFQMAVGIVVFHDWRREGGWWAGILTFLLGLAVLGITADLPVGTPLFSRLIWLGVLIFAINLISLLALDGARWLDTKDLQACVDTFDQVCSNTRCTCTERGLMWDICLDFKSCPELPGTSTTLLVSSVMLLVLALDSALIFLLGIKCHFFGGGVAGCGGGGIAGAEGLFSSTHINNDNGDIIANNKSVPNKRVFPSSGIGSKGGVILEEDEETSSTGDGAMPVNSGG